MERTGNEILTFRVDNLEKIVERMSTAVESIDESLKTLTRLDLKHEETNAAVGRCFNSIKSVVDNQTKVNDDIEARVRVINDEMPTLKMARNWIVGGVVGVVAIVGAAMVALVVIVK